MGNGIKRASEMLSPPSSPSKKSEAITAPREDSSQSEIANSSLLSARTSNKRSRSKSKKSPTTKANTGKNATPKKNTINGEKEGKSHPETPISSGKKRNRKKDSMDRTRLYLSKSKSNSSKDSNESKTKKNNNESSDRTGRSFSPEGKRKRQKLKRSKNSTVASSSLESTAIVVENEDGKEQKATITSTAVSLRSPVTKKKSLKKDYPITLHARVHRLRHMGYMPGSVSAFTPTSTKDGQVVVARTDGSYELKSIISSSTTGHHYSDTLSAPKHRLITIAKTAPLIGRKNDSENLEEDDSEMEDASHDGLLQICPDAASSLCWVYPYPSSTPICVGSGPNGNIWIVDFTLSRVVNVVSSAGGGIFDLSTCKFHDAVNGVKSLPFVAGACEDGCVRIWRVALGSDGQGKIEDPPLVTLPSAGAPVLSLAWKIVTVHKQQRTATFQTVMFASIADGTIRKYGLDIEEQTKFVGGLSDENNNGNMIEIHNKYYTIPNPPKSIMRMTIENKGRKDPTKVWSLLLLQDNTLVLGTSLGQIQFWNGETGTLTQTVIQSNSQADVLKIVGNSDETKIFCSGVDSRVVCLERKQSPLTTSPPPSGSELTALVTSHLTTYRPWKMTISQRPHTHDVKAMAIVASSSNILSSSIETLLTGGLDTKICSYSVSTFAQTPPQTWYPWPSASSLFSCTTNVPKGYPKLLSMQHHDRIELYELETLTTKNKAIRSKYLKQDISQYPTSIPVGRIQLGGPNVGDDDDDEGDDDNNRIILPSSSPLQASSLSPNGKFLAISNASSTYVFHLKYDAAATNEKGSAQVQPEKLELPEALQNVSATTFLFTDDELYIGDSSCRQKVHIWRLPQERNKYDDNCTDAEGEKHALTKLPVQTVCLPESQKSKIGEEIILPIQSIHMDGEFMVTSSHARENAIHIFRRRTNEAPYEHFWTLPNLGGRADARPAAVALIDNKKLAVATYRSHLYLLDIETRSLNEWSEQYGFPIREKKWTEDSLCGRGYPLRLIPQKNGVLVMASFGTFCVINLNKPMPRRCRKVPKRPVWKNRRKFKPIVYNDNNDDDGDNDDHWLEPRVTTVVEDEYSHNDPDGDDDDATEAIYASSSPSKLNSNIIPIPQEIPDEELASRNCTICSHYKNMLYTDFLGPKEMLIVEQPWSEIAETFPAALQRRIYGAD